MYQSEKLNKNTYSMAMANGAFDMIIFVIPDIIILGEWICIHLLIIFIEIDQDLEIPIYVLFHMGLTIQFKIYFCVN